MRALVLIVLKAMQGFIFLTKYSIMALLRIIIQIIAKNDNFKRTSQ